MFQVRGSRVFWWDESVPLLKQRVINRVLDDLWLDPAEAVQRLEGIGIEMAAEAGTYLNALALKTMLEEALKA